MKKFKLLFIVLFTMFIMMPFQVFAFQLSVESEGVEDAVIEVEASDTIFAVKAKVEAALNIPVRRQILSYNGKKMEDGRTLRDFFEIQPNLKIQVTLKDELNVYYVTFDNPVAGAKPDFLGDVILANKDNSKKVEFKDIKLDWAKFSADMSDSTLLNSNDVFEDGSMYTVNIAAESMIFINEELEKKDCIVAEEGEIFYNGKALTPYSYYFYIGGVKTVDEVVDKLIIGKAFPKKIKTIFITDKETKEFEFDIDEWIELDEEGNKVKNATGVVEAGKTYLPSVDMPDDQEFIKYMSMMDMRTEMTWNGESESNYVGVNVYKVVFDANGGKFKDSDKYVIEEWDNKYADNLAVPVRDGYKFVGYFTEKTDGTKFEMILNESGIDSEMTFYAQWELAEENPNTYDGIASSILIGVISLITLVGSIIYFKKSKRA